jgi:hypothetical protein
MHDEITVVLTSTYPIAMELDLDATTLLKYGSTPGVLITHPGGPACHLLGKLYQQKPLPRMPLVTQAQRNLTNHVLSILWCDGNILLPGDVSRRALGLICSHFNDIGTGNDWLAPTIGVASKHDFQHCGLWQLAAYSSGNTGHPYALRDVQVCTNTTELDKSRG